MTLPKETDKVDDVTRMVNDIIEDSSLFTVKVMINSGNNIKVLLDGDNGINIDVIAKINKALRGQLEASDLFAENDFALEVGSPGIDRPLEHYRQYPKNIGRTVNVTLMDGDVINGVLKKVDKKEIVLEKTIGKNRKKKNQEIKQYCIAFHNIKATKVALEF